MANFGLEDPDKFLQPSDNSAIDAPSSNLILGVWQQSEVNTMRVPKTPGAPPFSNEVHLEKADSQQTYLDKQAIAVADNTASGMVAALANTNDPYRGDRALAILDTANGRESRLNHAYPYVPWTSQYTEPQGYAIYSGRLAGLLNESNVGSDNVYIGAFQADVASHIGDRNDFVQIYQSDADSVANLVNKHKLPKALQEVDRLVGAFQRRHSDDPDMVYKYVEDLSYELNQSKVLGQLQQEWKAEIR